MNKSLAQAAAAWMKKQDEIRAWYKRHPDQILPDNLRDALLTAERDYTRAKEEAAHEKRQ